MHHREWDPVPDESSQWVSVRRDYWAPVLPSPHGRAFVQVGAWYQENVGDDTLENPLWHLPYRQADIEALEDLIERTRAGRSTGHIANPLPAMIAWLRRIKILVGLDLPQS